MFPALLAGRFGANMAPAAKCGNRLAKIALRKTIWTCYFGALALIRTENR